MEHKVEPSDSEFADEALILHNNGVLLGSESALKTELREAMSGNIGKESEHDSQSNPDKLERNEEQSAGDTCPRAAGLKPGEALDEKQCQKRMLPIRDALDVISGKWKLMILISIMQGNHRFRDIERSIPKISAKVLAKELRDLEEHTLVSRVVYDERPVRVNYGVTPYAQTLQPVIEALFNWGTEHRKKIIGK